MRRRLTDRPSSRAAAPGFTLIELLVVLGIMAVAMIVVPSIVSGLPKVRLRAATDDMVATLRGLHQQAISLRDTTELVLDPAARTYRISTDAKTRALPPVVSAVGFGAIAIGPTGPSIRIRFFADGSASGGTIRLRHGDLSTSIAIDWLTGRVQPYD